MTFLSTLAQSYYYTNSYDTTSVSNADPATVAAAGAAVLVFIFITLIISVAFYVVAAIFLGRIFKKAGIKPWIAWVPFYNSWKFLELGGQQGFWAVLAIIPIVNYVSAVFMYIAAYRVGLKLGKSGAFVVLAIFLPIVWLIWLGADSSKWNDKASATPSIA